MWYSQNYHQEININLLKNSKFNPEGSAAIEMYLSRLEQEILSLDEKISYSNLTKGKMLCIYYLMIYYYQRS